MGHSQHMLPRQQIRSLRSSSRTGSESWCRWDPNQSGTTTLFICTMSALGRTRLIEWSATVVGADPISVDHFSLAIVRHLLDAPFAEVALDICASDMVRLAGSPITLLSSLSVGGRARPLDRGRDQGYRLTTSTTWPIALPSCFPSSFPSSPA